MNGSKKAYWAEFVRVAYYTGERGDKCNGLKKEYIDLLIHQHLELARVGGYLGHFDLPMPSYDPHKTIELQFCYMRAVPGVTHEIAEAVLDRKERRRTRIRLVDEPRPISMQLLHGLSMLQLVRTMWPEQAIAFRLRQEGSKERGEWTAQWFDYYEWCFTMIGTNVDHLHPEQFVSYQRSFQERFERDVRLGLRRDPGNQVALTG